MMSRYRQILSLVLLFGLSACASGNLLEFEHRFESTEQARAAVEDVLSFRTYKVKDARVSAKRLVWQYQIHDPNMRWLERQIDPNSILRLQASEIDRNHWLVRLEMSKTIVEFDVETRQAAERLGSALEYLRRPANAPGRNAP